MENQFTNSTNYTNQLGQQNNQQTPPTSQYNQQQPMNAQQQPQAPFSQQPMQQQQAPQMMGQQPMYNAMGPQVMQIPEYSDEQKQMQQKIQMDGYGLLKKRGELRLNVLIQLIVTIVILLFMTIAFFQLCFTGKLSGTDVKRFLTSEIYILDIVYFVLLVFGIIGTVFTSILMQQVRKIRVETVVNYSKPLKLSMLFTALFISEFFFMSSFWLMTSLTTYWLIFIFQIILAIAAIVFIFRVINGAEKIAKIAKDNNLKYDNKPVSEAIYYQPVSYRSVVQQPAPQTGYQPAPQTGYNQAPQQQAPQMGYQQPQPQQPAPQMGYQQPQPQQPAPHTGYQQPQQQAPHAGYQQPQQQAPHTGYNQAPQMGQPQNANTQQPQQPTQPPVRHDM